MVKVTWAFLLTEDFYAPRSLITAELGGSKASKKSRQRCEAVVGSALLWRALHSVFNNIKSPQLSTREEAITEV